MHYFRSGSISLGLLFALWAISGCDSGGSSSEVHRTAEFQKAALNSRDAMLEHMKSQKKKVKSRGKAR